jgi:hypothetical protein
MSTPGDDLLAVVSARQQLSWRSFREAFDALYSRFRTDADDPVAYVRRRSLRVLSELGHVDLLPYGAPTAICVAPSVLARLPQRGVPVAVLCGSRGAETMDALRNACSPFGRDARVTCFEQPCTGAYTPAAIFVEALDEDVLERVARRVGTHVAAYPPSWRILTYSASLPDYEAQLRWSSDPDPAWPRKDFNEEILAFTFQRVERPNRLSSFQDPLTHRQIHRIRRGNLTANVDRGWGRWLYLRDLGVRNLRFDDLMHTLAIPATVPLPGLLGRAIALFSGLAPLRTRDLDRADIQLDKYRTVSREAAELLGIKLGQAPIPHQFQT